ncbi:MAG: hypothetical protein GX174_03010 [Lentisphaerae bacterium]|jgi:hypothetical protein|nr:hypothetical protein [Lentisphaerota bacterium]
MQCAPTGCKRAVGIRPAALLFAVALLAAGLPMPALADQVVWSDGESWHGRLQPSGQGDLRFHDGQRLWQWRLDQVLAFDWHPATQRMERAWRFLEAGQTAREETGEPYPTLELDCTVTLADGRAFTGHLLTTVFYLEQGAETRKIVVRRKLRGPPGQTFGDVRYPSRLIVDSAEQTVRRTLRVSLAGDRGKGAEVALVTALPATTAMPVRRLPDGVFECEVAGTGCVWAVRDDPAIDVAWQDAATPALRERLRKALTDDLRDFFDQRELLGVSTNGTPSATVLALVLFSRAGATTLGGARTQPWRLEVCRWRVDDEGQNQFAARAVLFRGLRAHSDPLPRVTLHPLPDALIVETP